MNSIRKIIISSFLVLGVIACNKSPKVQNNNIAVIHLDTIINSNDSDEAFSSEKKDSSEKPVKVLYFEPEPKIDTLIANCHILYHFKDNNERFLLGKYKENSDTLYYYSGCEIILNIKFPNNLSFEKKINRDLFKEYIPKEEFPKYTINNMWVNHVNNSGAYFDLNICILDTDLCYDFELHVAPTGKFSIKEINYEEEDF